MKYFLSIIFIISLSFTGCSKKEESKLVAFSPEAFAYDLGDSWEVNADVNVRGFKQNKNNEDIYEVSLSFKADLVTPSGKEIKNIYSDVLDKKQDEEFSDLPIELQFDLDSTYSDGKYKLLIHIKDNYSKRLTDSSVEFSLEE